MNEEYKIKLVKIKQTRPIGVYVVILFIAFAFVGKLRAIVPDTVRTSIYPQNLKNKSNLYNFLWGIHYRTLYSTPIIANVATMSSLSDGMHVLGQAPEFHGLILQDRQQRLFMIKPLGGSTSFLESKFFREMYNSRDFKGSYLDEFIGDAYTIINPYTFLATDYMAKAAGLNFNNTRIYYYRQNLLGRDTIANGSSIGNKLISFRTIPDTLTGKNILTTEQFLEQLRRSKSNRVNEKLYVTERLFDMLIGDWNKIPENWNWQAVSDGDGLLYSPIVIDRNHAFTKVDGFLFKRMLDALQLGFITNYSKNPENVEKINTLGYTLDLALTNESAEGLWMQQVRFLQSVLTDSLINLSFSLLPPEVRGPETDAIVAKLKYRRDNLGRMAVRYYRKLQQNPVITGTDHDDKIVVSRKEPDMVKISVYSETDTFPSFEKNFDPKYTKEIWLYGLDGNDRYEVQGEGKKGPFVYLVTGPGDNSFDIQADERLRIYAYRAEKDKLRTFHGVRKIFTDEPSVHDYDYQKVKRHTFSFTPWGFYDSDVGFNLGAFFTYTAYGFKQSPFTYQHRIGYNYRTGFMYQGIFPTYDPHRTFQLDLSISSPRNFSNFFGYGNNTDGFKDEKKDYNRVSMRTYSLVPSFRMEIGEYRQLTMSASFEMFKALHSDGRYINNVYPEEHSVFKRNLFAGVQAEYKFNKIPAAFISKFETDIKAGWKMNIQLPERNFPYANTKVSSNFSLTDRFSIATELDAELLFSNKYDFYQAASIGLRGLRDNRFIGKQAFYQLTDFRLDMGKIRNPFTPLKYGLFVGFDYGRVWFPGEYSRKWHTSYGGGVWLTVLNKFTTKYSWFGSKDGVRFSFELGLGF